MLCMYGGHAEYINPCALEGKTASKQGLRDLVKWEISHDQMWKVGFVWVVEGWRAGSCI